MRKSEAQLSVAEARVGHMRGNPDFRPDWALKKSGPSHCEFRRKGWRLVIEKRGNGWFYIWRGEEKPLGTFAAIEDPTGQRWIIVPPTRQASGNRLTYYPRKPCENLAKSLRWAHFMELQAAPELAHERPRLGAVTQILKALAEAHGRDDQKLFEKLEKEAARYLQKLNIDDEPPELPRWRRGSRIVVPRAVAAEHLAEYWEGYLLREDVNPGSIVDEYVQDLWHGSYYVKITTGLSLPSSEHAAAIVAEFEKARSHLHEAAERQKLAGRLCDLCLRDIGQDCQEGPSHQSGRNLYWSRARDLARGLVRSSLFIMGMPRARARSLFDHQRKREARMT